MLTTTTIFVVLIALAAYSYVKTRRPKHACPKCGDSCFVRWQYQPKMSVKRASCTNIHCDYERVLAWEQNNREGSKFIDVFPA